jgi:hypothetical protein
MGLSAAIRTVLFNPQPKSILAISGANKSITGGELVEGRTSSATYVDASGVLQTAAANAPVWENGGLRHEGTATNLFLRSAEIDSASWGKTASTVDVNATAGPDGNTTADKLMTNTSSAEHSITQAVSVTTGFLYTISMDVKPAEETFAFIGFTSAGFGVASKAIFNLSTLAITYLTVGTGITGKIIPLANGFYRCSASKMSDTDNAAAILRVGLTKSDSSSTSTGANTTDGLYLTNLGVKQNDISSHITTTTAAVPRATCALSVPLVLNQNFYQKSAILMRVRAKLANSATAKSWLTPSTTAEGLIDKGSGALTFKDSAANTATAILTSWAADTIILVAIVTDNVTGLMSLSASKDNGATWIASEDTAFAGLTVGANWLLFSANTQVFETLGWNVIKSNKGFAQMKAYVKANILRLTQ